MDTLYSEDTYFPDITITKKKKRSTPEHLQFQADKYWQKISPYKNVTVEEFTSFKWQNKNTIFTKKDILAFLIEVSSPEFVSDVTQALDLVPMQVRITPYLLSLINWDDPLSDPIRLQFIPLASEILPDHPLLLLDSLAEEDDSPLPNLVHRYPDKVLFLPQNRCPVYCRYCTRSYSVGSDTSIVSKSTSGWSLENQEQVYKYIKNNPDIEDVVLSGGDVYNLSAKHLRSITRSLLEIPNVLRIRLATKGLAINPTRITEDNDWTQALLDVTDYARKLNKQVALHTHFNHPVEITDLTKKAMEFLHSKGVIVRNQTVLLRHVNDNTATLSTLIKKLSAINIQPYYVYQHDMVSGLEFLRTPLWKLLELEEQIRGMTAGFNTPTFVVDLPGGGGKRNAWSFKHYDTNTGLSVYVAPAVRKGQKLIYADPLHSLPEQFQQKWGDQKLQKKMKSKALESAEISGNTFVQNLPKRTCHE